MSYGEYCQQVFNGRSAAETVRDFGLVLEGLDEWLGVAESDACSGDVPEEWSDHHTRALAELVTAIESQESSDDSEEDCL